MTAEKQVNFRMPNSLKEEVKASADKNRRTMAAEIVVLIEKALENEKSGTTA